MNLGTAAITVGRQIDAREHFVEGLELARQAGDRMTVASCSGGLGELYSQQDQFELAERHYLESLPFYGDDRVNAAIAFSNLARNAIACRVEAKAVHYLRELKAIAAQKYRVPVAVYFLWNCAGLAALREEWAIALRLSSAADSTGKQHGFSEDYVDARFHARAMAPVRDALGAAAADAAAAVGLAMDVDEALREAEAWLEALPAAESPP